MKKIGIAILVILIVVSLTAFGVSCQTEAAAEETAEETAGETDAMQEVTDEMAEGVAGDEVVAGGELYIVHIPKVVHPWFDIVQIGAEAMARTLSAESSTEVFVEYIAPGVADVTEQNSIMQQAAAKGVSGIFIDPLDQQGNKQVFSELRDLGILITLYDCSPFEDYTAVAASAVDSAGYELRRLMELLDEEGKVAVMQGMPTAPSHKQRYDYLMEELKNYPNIEVVDGGVDNDDMETARQQAAATIAAHPDLDGYLGCDAAFPVGVAQAIKEAGKVGEIMVVGLGEMTSILDYVKEGVLESTVYVAPDMQGAYSVLLHYMWEQGYYTQGIQIPKFIDMGCSYIDQSNVDEYFDRFNVPIEGIVE